MLRVLSPADNSCVDLYTPVQQTFIEKIRAAGIEAALDWLLPAKDNRELTIPAPVHARWESDGTGPFSVEISETETFSAPRVLSCDAPCCAFVNLKVGQAYFWRVNGGTIHRFRTLARPYRFIAVDGLFNVRDLGGLGIRQGLLYRGSDLDGEYHITEAGKQTFHELGIRTELNLRKERPEPRPHSAAGSRVAYHWIPYRPYLEIFEDEHRENIRRIFAFLADPSHYPVYFHCLGGADRTGMIALYLRALMGEDDEDILIDYELTSLSTFAGGLTEGVAALGFRSRERDYFRNFYTRYQTYGANLQEMTRRFLAECGVPDETLRAVCAILSPEKK